MKEYLEEQEDGAYKLVLRGDAIKPDDIEVPDGFVMLARPYKDADLYFYNQDFSIYCTLCGTIGKCGLGKNHKFHKIIWQRSETEYLMQGKNGERLMESVGQLKGMKYDNDKPRHSLLPKGSVNTVIDVLEFGAKKYKANNWQKVDNAKERYYNAAMRHIDKWWNGEKRDPETNIHHLAHAATNLFFLMWFDENGE